ncbi:MAG: histidine--tRNA ligase [Desulfovibrionaceae bacterium]|nr:histidine--tRNA ligase [Desulfovibrionaceae bacterium]
MSISRINGFADLFDSDAALFDFMESTCRTIFSRYGFKEVRVPIMEYTELFARGIGTETDVVQKEMYTFPDAHGKLQSLRPEATAGVMRAYINASLHARESVSKLFTYGPMFRCERPQKGRMRQFHQIDCELIGTPAPAADAEVVSLLVNYMDALGLENLSLHLNTLGCPNCRPKYRQALIDHLTRYESSLCEDCQRRLHTNPLRVLDCKRDHDQEALQTAPVFADYICDDCRAHYETVTGLLTDSGISYVQDHCLVRGLDYYCRTTFELRSDAIGAQTAVAGGGRYDGLIRNLGGPDVPGIGFACGMERLALLMGEREAARKDFYVVCLDDACVAQGFRITRDLRLAGLKGEMGYTAAGMKSSMRQAGKSGARYTLILGSDEMARQVAAVKDMDQGSQQDIELDQLVTVLSHKD